MSQFIHIGLNFSGESNRSAELKPVFDRALDWIRYAPNCWIVWTSSDPEKWYERLKPHLKEGEHIFIVKLDISQRQGWLPKSTWDWINKDRSET